MLKTMQIYKKIFFFGFSLFFAIFGFFSKILSNKWVKNWVATQIKLKFGVTSWFFFSGFLGVWLSF
jgi:hypothetical protein